MIDMQSKMSQSVLAILASLFLGWSVHLLLPSQSAHLNLLVAALIVVTAGLLLLVLYRQYFWKGLTFQHFLLSLMLGTSFLGSALFTKSVGPITLFPYRILLVLLTITLFYNWLKKDFTIKDQFQIPFVYLFLIAWIGYSLLALSWSVELIPALKEVITLLTGILVIFYVSVIFKQEKNYREFFTIWVVMGFLLIGIGFINHFLHIHLSISRIIHAYSYQQGIPTSVFVNENDFGSFLGITFFFFLSLMKNGKRLIYQFAGLFGVISSIYLILITESRANYIGVFLGLVFWFVFLVRRKEKLLISLAGAAVAPLAIFAQLEKAKALGSMILIQFESLLQTKNQKSSVDIRENLLKNAKTFIEDTFGFGVGPGNVEYYMKNFQRYPTFHNYNPHNWWAEIFVQYGFLIFTGYILMFAFLFVSIYRIWKVQVKQRNTLISEALVCGMISFVMASISPNSFIALNYNWIFIAFVIAYINFHYKGILHPGGQR